MALPINNNQPLGATRVHGDADGVVNFDIGMTGDNSVGIIIATGLTKSPTAFKITANVATLTSEMGVGGVVESVLRRVGVASTTTMYQVDGAQISLLVEATGFDDANLAAALNSPALSTTANVANIVPVSFTVSSTEGFKLA